MCKCKEVHTEQERRRAREGAAERKKAKRGGNRTAPGYPDRSMIGMAPHQSANGTWGGAPYEFAPQQSATGCWDGELYVTMPQQQRWGNERDVHYPQADKQWENATAEYYQQPNGELTNCKQQGPTYINQGPKRLKSGDFVPNIEHNLAMPLPTIKKLAGSMISDQSTIVDDQGNNCNSDQSGAVGDQTESRDPEESTVVDDQGNTADSDQSTIVGNQVNTRLEITQDLSPSPPVAVGSVTASRRSSHTRPAVQKTVAAEDVQTALLNLSVFEALDNANGPS